MTALLGSIQLLGKTAAQWTSDNTILLDRQPGLETDTLKWKVGDGTTDWNSLPYFNDTDIAADWGNIGGTLSNQTDLQNALNAKEPAFTTLPVNKGGTGLNSLGTPLYFLRVNAGGTALEYAAVAAPVWGGITGTLSSQTDLQSALDAKQATLVNQVNIKSINGNTLLGSGDLTISTTPAGNTGEIQFNNAGAFGADSGLFWDNANKRLGVGTNAPKAKCQINGLLSFVSSVVTPSPGANFTPSGSTLRIATYYENFIINGLGTALNGGTGVTSLDLFALGTAGGWSGELRFFTSNSSTTPVERLSIKNTGLIGINETTPLARIHTKAAAATDIVSIFQGATSQSANLSEWRDSAGSVLASVGKGGSFNPVSLADSAAPNNSIYYSTDASKLVYKDGGGVVNNLY